MDDKLRDIFDSFDPEEVDELLRDIDIKAGNAKDPGTNVSRISEKRIRKEVLKKTGVRRMPSRRRIYAIAASAAVFFISVGIIGYVQFFGPKSSSKDGSTSDYLAGDTENFASDYDMAAESITDEAEEPATDMEEAVESRSGEGVNVGVESASDGMADENVALISADSMSSDEVEQTLYESAYEMDTDNFTARFHTLGELEADCDYIVVGVKTGSSFVQTDEENVYGLEAGFRIEKVLSDNSGEDISDNVTITEGVRYEPIRGVYVRIGGYSYMKTGNEYVLFLKDASGGKYRIDGIVYGMIPVDEPETGFALAELGTDNEVVRTLKTVIRDAWDKYVAGPGTSASTQTDGEEPDLSATAAPVETDEPNDEDDTELPEEPETEPEHETVEH